MKKKIKTLWTAVFSIALRNFADQLSANYPQCNPKMISDLEAIANLSMNCYSVEIICNASVNDDKEFSYDENL